MPFDGAEKEFDERLRVLTQIADEIERVATLLEREDQWCKGTLSTPDGRHCILGAMSAVKAGRVVELVLLNAIKDVTGRRFSRIDAFNDAASTSHAHVLAVLKRAEDNVRRGVPLGVPKDRTSWSTALGRRVVALRDGLAARAGWVQSLW